MKTFAEKNSFIINYPEIAREWHPTKNENVKIENVSACSNVKAWWKCSVCGKEWQATVNHRTVGNTGCPICSKKDSAAKKVKTHAKRNNFADNYPLVAAEWHPTKNGEMKPEEFSSGSNKRVWWLCGFCGNEWEATINKRTTGRGCPICSKANTSLPEQTVFFYVQKVFPDALNRFKKDFEFDIYIPSVQTAIEYDGSAYHKTPKALIKDNNKDRYCAANGIRLIRFRAPKLADTEHAVRITCEDYQIEKGLKELFKILEKDCPDIDIDRDRIKIINCFRNVQNENSIAAKFPLIVKEWNYQKNGKINPAAVAAMSNVKFWWKCRVCGYEWQAAANKRCGAGRGCPFCAGKVVVAGKNDLETLYPEIAAEWDYEKNAPLLPAQVTPHSNKKVWWKCKEFGHIWQTSVNDRVNDSTKCPFCRNKKVLKGFNDLATTNPRLAEEWSEKNEIKPTEVTAGSEKKVWWKCRACGHEWQAVIYSRKNNGCPICGKKKIKKPLTK